MGENFPKILVIDDNPNNLDILSELLDKQNFVTLFALDGLSGIERAESGQPDLILLDIMMPGIDGFEACRRLKANEKTQDIPIIFMTALAETTNKVQGFALGAVDYITKPIHPEEVLARINTHLKIQRLQRDLSTKNGELQAANEELQAALEREQELNTLKSRFISIASHEFRSPLALIGLTIDMLQQYSNRITEEKKTASFEKMKHAVKQMVDLLDEVLIITKAETETFDFHPEPTDVKQLCQELTEEFSFISAETHAITLSMTDDHFKILADPGLLRHILSNLLSNAIKYSPTGGSVRFELDRSNAEVIFRVKDNGIGIPHEDQSHLFEAFHRGGNVGNIQGTGLGLVIVKQFVELHSGRINVESLINQGTTVTVVIPARAEIHKF